MLSLQANSLKIVWSSLSEDEKISLIEDFLNDVQIVAWRDSENDTNVLRAITSMNSAKYITKKTLERTSRLIHNVLLKQSQNVQYQIAAARSFTFYANFHPEQEHNKKDPYIESNLQKYLKIHGFNAMKIRYKVSEGEDKYGIMNLSYLVHHYNESKELLKSIGYDLSSLEAYEEIE